MLNNERLYVTQEEKQALLHTQIQGQSDFEIKDIFEFVKKILKRLQHNRQFKRLWIK
jgi:flagellar biosynthesis/type III secretory pathway chaperone